MTATARRRIAGLAPGRFFSSWDRWPASLSRASHRTPDRYKAIEVFDPEHRIVTDERVEVGLHVKEVEDCIMR